MIDSNISLDALIESLEADKEKGLSSEEAAKRLSQYGRNEMEAEKHKSIILKFAENFKEFMIIILIIAAAISFFLGEGIDALIIMLIVVLNALISTIQETKAEKSLEALKAMTVPKCVVMRDGEMIEINAAEVVPGDLVIIDAGDSIPADGRLVEASSLKVEESALTGESVPVEKDAEVELEANVQIGDRINQVFSSTVVTYGRASFIATGTGMNTEIGKIAGMIMEEKEELTPLQVKLKEIGKILGLLVIVVCLLIFGLGMLQGRDRIEMFFTAVSLAVAAIPEGLPAVVTIVLALGVQRLSKKNAVIRKLPAVETLGSSSVICSDKTGTLTQNKMTVMKSYTDMTLHEISKDDSRALFEPNKQLIEGMVLCNDASIHEEEEIGDPTETALLRFGQSYGMNKSELDSAMPREEEVPFDSDRKMMTTVHKLGSGFRVYTKGALDSLLDHCQNIIVSGDIEPLTDEHKDQLHEINQNLGEHALRVLGLAYKDIDSMPGTIDSETLERDLIFVGCVAMIDPPRDEAKESIAKCIKAGIKPVMITGDHKVTASAIAKELGILKEGDKVLIGKELANIDQEELNRTVQDYSVYARVSPEHKVRIVKAWQSQHKVVAMTGDGVNDAPALKMAEIGTAMGQVGTDVSRGASDMVLMDDNFATIVAAVEEGRVIFSNIRRSIRYLLSCNMGEVFLLFFAMLLNLKVPLLPIHILWINLVTDSFPALALGVEPGDPHVMDEPPREKNESVFAGGLLKRIILEGFMVGSLSLAVFYFAQPMGLQVARTMTFLTLAFTQLAHSINVRSDHSVLFKKGLFTNKYSLIAILVSGILQVAVVITPGISTLFKVSSLNYAQWTAVLVWSLMPLLVLEVEKLTISKIHHE